VTQRSSVIYLFAQGVLTFAWWLLLWVVPDSRAFFIPGHYHDDVLLSFWMADLVCVAGGSVVAGLWMRSRDARAAASAWFTSGALVYAALYCVATTSLTGEAILASGLMVPAAGVTTFIASRRPVA
jgi:hypothetical protein